MALDRQLAPLGFAEQRQQLLQRRGHQDRRLDLRQPRRVGTYHSRPQSIGPSFSRHGWRSTRHCTATAYLRGQASFQERALCARTRVVVMTMGGEEPALAWRQPRAAASWTPRRRTSPTRGKPTSAHIVVDAVPTIRPPPRNSLAAPETRWCVPHKCTADAAGTGHHTPSGAKQQSAVSAPRTGRQARPPLQRSRSLASGAADRLARERTAEQTHQPVRADRQHRRLRDDVHQLVVHLPAMRAPPHSTTPATHRRSLPGGTRRCDSALRALGSFFSSMRMKTSASVCEPISVGTKYSGSMSCRRESA